MTAGIWAVLPLKDLDTAKQRLAPVLVPGERRALYRAMLEDVLEALSASRATGALAGTVVVTRDAEIEALARRYATRIIGETENRGQSAAVAHAAGILASEGTAGIVTVPGDVPLVTGEEIGTILGAHGTAPAITIAPARDERGSNAVCCSPPDCLAFQFGNDSFEPHQAGSRALGIEPRIVRLPGIGLDVDSPEDLATFAAHPSATRAYQFLVTNRIVDRLKQ